MEFYGDYHTHSRHSDGRQNEKDIIEAARECGLKEVAITDHGPLAAVIGVKDADEYAQIRQTIEQLNDESDELRVLVGAEANIRDLRGTLDIPPDVVKELDILIAGMHPYTMPTSLKDGWELFAQNSLRHLGKAERRKAVIANTKACVEAIRRNPELDILSHPGLFFTVDIEEVANACVKNEVLFEINCGHEHPGISDIMKANQAGVNFIINSDSHFKDSVGNLDYGKDVVEMLNIKSERVVNLDSGGGYARWGKKVKNCTYS